MKVEYFLTLTELMTFAKKVRKQGLTFQVNQNELSITTYGKSKSFLMVE